MKVIRISLQLTGKVAERYLEYKTWHSDFTPSDSQMAQALILAGLDTWESRTLPTLTHTSKLTTKTHQPK